MLPVLPGDPALLPRTPKAGGTNFLQLEGLSAALGGDAGGGSAWKGSWSALRWGCALLQAERRQQHRACPAPCAAPCAAGLSPAL